MLLFLSEWFDFHRSRVDDSSCFKGANSIELQSKYVDGIQNKWDSRCHWTSITVAFPPHISHFPFHHVRCSRHLHTSESSRCCSPSHKIFNISRIKISLLNDLFIRMLSDVIHTMSYMFSAPNIMNLIEQKQRNSTKSHINTDCDSMKNTFINYKPFKWN